MSEIPKTQYARSGDLHIAYQILGSGPPDLATLGPTLTHLDRDWDFPQGARFIKRFATFCRLIRLDRRGTGLSDRPDVPASLEDDASDLEAVCDAAGAERPFISGVGQGGSLALYFAATRPDRCAGVIAYSTPARYMRSDDYPYGWDEATLQMWLDRVEGGFATDPEIIGLMAPSLASDEQFVHAMQLYGRSAASPKSAAVSWETLARSDIRDILHAVTVPVLVLHRTGDRLFPVEQSRDLASRLPNARFVELPGDDWFPIAGDSDSYIDEIQAFITGARPSPPTDRFLTTVLFTDFVGSTESAAKAGDRVWRTKLDEHDNLVRDLLDRFGGKWITHRGDGVVAMFDGPARAVRCAQSIRDEIAKLGIEMRTGLHTGELERRGDDYSGMAMNIAARVMSLADAGQILVSRTIPDLVWGSGLEFEDRGLHELKGVPGTWQLYAVKA